MKDARSANRYVSVPAQDIDIQYDASWTNATVGGRNPVKSTTNPKGASTATYNFHGIAIYLWGYIGPAGPPTPSVECYVDNVLAPPTPEILYGKPDGIALWVSRQICFQDQLTDGNHTFKLVVTDASDAYPFMLDFLQFSLSSQQYEDLNVEGQLGAAASSSSTSSTPTSSTASTSATTTVQPASQSDATSAGPIVGAVLGTIVGMALIAVGIYFVVRRRRQAYSKLGNDDLHQDEEKIVPFTTPRRRPLFLSPASTLSIVPESDDASEVPGPSTAAATYQPSPGPSTESVRPTKDRKSAAAGLFKAFGRVRRRTDPDSTMSEIPSEAPPMYSSEAAQAG